MRSPVPRAALAPGCDIPRIVNGCWQLAADHRRERRDPRQLVDGLRRLAELGLTAFDGADIYTGVEERLGDFRRAWIAGGGDPGALRFHTKLVPDRDALPSVDAAAVEAIVARSRRRLGVECLDLVQLHWWDFEVPGWAETAGWLDGLRRRGWIAHLGVTNFDAAHLGEILAAGVPIVSNQIQYSLLDRRPERRTAGYCRRRGIALLAYGVLAGGFLAGRWLGQPDPGKGPGNRSLTKYRLIIDELGGWSAFQALLRTVDRVARKHRSSVANVATRWALDRPGVAAVILGAASAAHATDNLRAFDLVLDAEDRERIAARLAELPGPPGDVYSVERVPGGRHAAVMKMNLHRDGTAAASAPGSQRKSIQETLPNL